MKHWNCTGKAGKGLRMKMVLLLMTGVMLSQSAYSVESVNPASARLEAVSLYVSNLYYGLLARHPDQSGFDFWTTNAVAGRVSCAQVAASFIMTPQFQARTGVANEVHIHSLYFTLLGRRADDSGVAYFLKAIASGSMTRHDLARSILRSAEFDARCRSHYGFPGGAGTLSGAGL